MINTYKKGQNAERTVEKLLLHNNYVLAYKAPHVRFSKCHDMFNAWDILAIREDLKREFIQVKCNISDYYTAKKKLMAWVKMFGVESEEYTLWLFKGKKGNKLFNCRDGKEKNLLLL
jgi:hypothetical protein